MQTALIIIGILLLALLAVGGYAISVYNRLVTLRERYKNGFSQIDVQLKRRYDLIPNLVNAVKGYMSHEKETLERVISARNAASAAANQAAADPANASAVRELSTAETGLGGALGRLFMLSEAYPDLKADTQTSQLMEELTSTENRIAFARQHFNDSVMTYNAYRQSFPPALVAGPAGFGEAALFEVHDDAERQAVKVNLDPATA
jgi:LemA protein